MSKVRVVYNPDRSVAVIHPVPKSKRSNETEEQWLERVFNKAMRGELKDLPYDDIDSSELPSREDRTAWEGEKGKGVKINSVKAEQIKDKREKQIKIQDELRKLAEESLKAKGEL